MKALVIGHSVYDITCGIENFPEENSKTHFTNSIESSGGCACNMAYALGKYGVDTYLASALGDDTFATFIRNELSKIGVHTEYMETVYEKRTNLSLILANSKNGSRTIFTIEKEPLYLKKSEFQFEPDLVLIDGYDYGASLAALNKYSNKITIIDAGTYNSEVVQLCKYCQYIVASKEFAESLTGQKINYDNPQSLVYVYTAFANKFPNKQIIITIEDRGALYMTDGQIRVMPGLQSQVLDTTGCGDIFHAAFGYGLLKGYNLEQSITLGNIAAGLSVNKIGFINSVASLDEIMPYFNQKYPNVTMQNNVVQAQATVQVAPTYNPQANVQNQVPNNQLPPTGNPQNPA